MPRHDWETHPLSAVVSLDKSIHSLSQRRGPERSELPLGSVRLMVTQKRYYFHPLSGVQLSDTQLWQIMCYVHDQNQMFNEMRPPYPHV